MRSHAVRGYTMLKKEHMNEIEQPEGKYSFIQEPVNRLLMALSRRGLELIGGKDLGLTAVEFELLKVLAAHPGRIYTRDQLMDAMYRDERVVSDRTVDSHVKKIRRKIADVVPEREIIHSVYGLGYKYEW